MQKFVPSGALRRGPQIQVIQGNLKVKAAPAETAKETRAVCIAEDGQRGSPKTPRERVPLPSQFCGATGCRAWPWLGVFVMVIRSEWRFDYYLLETIFLLLENPVLIHQFHQLHHMPVPSSLLDLIAPTTLPHDDWNDNE
jgi:hypothetical protein